MISRDLVVAAAIASGAFWTQAARAGSTPLQHVIFIMQENRSFDHYFGTFPGANGIPSGVCIPINPSNPGQGCVAPFHDTHDINSGGPHTAGNALRDIDGTNGAEKMDGWLQEQTNGGAASCTSISTSSSKCPLLPGVMRHDAVGYHTADELPNYWAYAQNFVLQDMMFESVRGYSLVSHLDLTSEWSASCKDPLNVSTCTTDPNTHVDPVVGKITYPWVNLFQLLDTHGVSWKYYLANGTEPDCDDGQMTCAPQVQTAKNLSLWNPVPGYAWVVQQGPAYLTAHNPPLDQFISDVKSGNLPQVAWIMPSDGFSEHPTNGVTEGQDYVTSLINAVMQSPYWANTAIFLAWDDWGGFYDHVVPPIVDTNKTKYSIEGYGFRVPGLLISAYAKPGYIDHSVLSFNSYATFIEDLFMNGARLDPVAMGQPDARPTIRDELTQVTFPNGTAAPIGNLFNEFDFSQAPQPPLVLSTHIPVQIVVACGSTTRNLAQACTNAHVKINWQPVNGASVPGPFTYQVLRDGTPLPQCAKGHSYCVDNPAPSGVHIYRVYSVDQNGVSSPASAGAEADVP